MLSVIVSFVILFIIEHGPLQMFGPLVEVYNYLALEKIYRMLIPGIRAPADLWGQTIISQRGGHGHPRNYPPPPPIPATPLCAGIQFKSCDKRFGVSVLHVVNASELNLYRKATLQKGNLVPRAFPLKKNEGKSPGDKVDRKDRRVVILYKSINWRTGWAFEVQGTVPVVLPRNSTWPGRRAVPTTTISSTSKPSLSRRKQQ